jgi:hypothetical protein
MKEESSHSITCDDMGKLMERVIAGEAEVPDLGQVRDHVGSCARCRSDWGGVFELIEWPDKTTVRLPEGRSWAELAARTKWRLAAAAHEEFQPRKIRVMPLVGAVLLAVLLLAMIPAGIVGGVDLAFSADLFGSAKFWTYYGVAFVGQVLVFHVMAAFLYPLLRYPLRSRDRRHVPGLRTYVFSL